MYMLKGDPAQLARARFGIHQSNEIIYESHKTIKLVSTITLQNQHNEAPPLDGPLALTVTFFFPIPIRCTAKNQYLYISKPSMDDLITFVLDISQSAGILRSHASICRITSEKRYATKPRTEFSFSVLKEKHGPQKKN